MTGAQGPAGAPGPVGPQGPPGPSGAQVWSSFLPLFSQAYVASTFTPDSNIALTRLQSRAIVSPISCRTNAILQVSDGTTAGTVTLTISAAENDTGPIALNYSAGTPIRVSIITAAQCNTLPALVNLAAQYKAR